MGGVDFDYELDLPDEALSHYNINLDKIEKVTDLSFLTAHKDLCDHIQFNSSNYLIKFLLYLNKSQIKKS